MTTRNPFRRAIAWLREHVGMDLALAVGFGALSLEAVFAGEYRFHLAFWGVGILFIGMHFHDKRLDDTHDFVIWLSKEHRELMMRLLHHYHLTDQHGVQRTFFYPLDSDGKPMKQEQGTAQEETIQ